MGTCAQRCGAERTGTLPDDVYPAPSWLNRAGGAQKPDPNVNSERNREVETPGEEYSHGVTDQCGHPDGLSKVLSRSHESPEFILSRSLPQSTSSDLAVTLNVVVIDVGGVYRSLYRVAVASSAQRDRAQGATMHSWKRSQGFCL